MGNIFQRKLIPCIKDDWTRFFGCDCCCEVELGLFIWAIISILVSGVGMAGGELYGLFSIAVYILYLISTIPTPDFPPANAKGIMLRVANMLYCVMLIFDIVWLILVNRDYFKICTSTLKDQLCGGHMHYALFNCYLRVVLDFVLGYFVIGSSESIAKRDAGSTGGSVLEAN